MKRKQDPYARGGRVPLGLRRAWKIEDGRPVPTLAIDPVGRTLAYEIFLLAGAGYSVRRIVRTMSAQYGRHFRPMTVHAILNHELYVNPPDEALRIVPRELVFEARIGLLQRRRGGRPREKPTRAEELIDRRTGAGTAARMAAENEAAHVAWLREKYADNSTAEEIEEKPEPPEGGPVLAG